MNGWQDVLRGPKDGDHIVQVYQEPGFLASAVAEYIGVGLQQGEAAIVIARPQHIKMFKRALEDAGIDVAHALSAGQLTLLDAERALSRFMRDGMPQWASFREQIGGAIAEMRRKYPVIRAYGEMVDLLWQRGEQDAAIRLEEFWNELAKLQTFSLFCAYYLDNLDSRSYAGLHCICKVHSHLIPAREYDNFDETVARASEKVLDQPLARMLLSLSSIDRPNARMPIGQAILLWLQKNMPMTAERVLAEIRASTP